MKAMTFSGLTTEKLKEFRSRMRFATKNHTVTSKPGVLNSFVGGVCPWPSVSVSIRVKATFLSVEMRLFCIARPRDLREESEAHFRGIVKEKFQKMKISTVWSCLSYSLIDFRTEIRILGYIYRTTFNFVREYKLLKRLHP